MKVSLTGLSTQRSPAAQIPSPRVPNAKPPATMISASTPPSDTKYQSIKCLKPVNLRLDAPILDNRDPRSAVPPLEMCT